MLRREFVAGAAAFGLSARQIDPRQRSTLPFRRFRRDQDCGGFRGVDQPAALCLSQRCNLMLERDIGQNRQMIRTAPRFVICPRFHDRSARSDVDAIETQHRKT
jgi:hypothetical protein